MLKQVTEKVESLISPGQEMKRKDFIDAMDIEGFKYGTIRNIDRSLKFLVDRGKFDKSNDKLGVYIRIT